MFHSFSDKSSLVPTCPRCAQSILKATTSKRFRKGRTPIGKDFMKNLYNQSTGDDILGAL